MDWQLRENDVFELCFVGLVAGFWVDRSGLYYDSDIVFYDLLIGNISSVEGYDRDELWQICEERIDEIYDSLFEPGIIGKYPKITEEGVTLTT